MDVTINEQDLSSYYEPTLLDILVMGLLGVAAIAVVLCIIGFVWEQIDERRTRRVLQAQLEEATRHLEESGLVMQGYDEIDIKNGTFWLDCGDMHGVELSICCINEQWTLFADLPNGERRLVPIEEINRLRYRTMEVGEDFVNRLPDEPVRLWSRPAPSDIATS